MAKGKKGFLNLNRFKSGKGIKQWLKYQQKPRARFNLARFKNYSAKQNGLA